ncbi:MAG: ROK family protein [Clostridia bacterium]|nr:ROK family protein [Clostridia bacterium]
MRVGAVDFGGTAIKYGIWEAGQLTGLSERPSPTGCAADVVDALTDIINGLGKLDAVGISTRGQVDGNGAILYDNGPVADYTGTPLKALLEARLGIPVWVENDVNAAAWGEACLGAGKGCGDFLCLTYGTGIGGAIVLNGQLYRGANWSAGEFGAMQLFSQKPAWPGFGGAYYENFASAAALVDGAKAVDPALTDGKKVCACMDDPAIAPLVEQWVSNIGWGLSSLIHVFNPGLIVLGGGILQNEELFRRIDTFTRAQLMPGFEVVQLKQAQLGNRAGLIGAALLAERSL